MEMVAAKLIDDEEPLVDSESAALAVPAAAVPGGFVPATKAQVAYWRQLCGAITTRGAGGMHDTDWPPDLSPNSFTLRELQARHILVRRSGAWHLRRGWFAALSLLRLTAVPTPPLLPAERPGPDLPTFAELEQWELVCRWLDTQPGMRARLPILGVPGLPVPGAVSSEMLRGMRKYRLVRHSDDCTWRLSPTWKVRLSTLWQGILKAEGEREPQPSNAPAPYSVAAGIDTWYLNRIDESGLPTALHMALDDLQAQAKDEDDEVETLWEYDGVPLMMYRAGVSTRQGGGVSWSYILRNASLTLLIRKSPLGGIIAQARLGSECLWRQTPLAALNELDLLVRRLWQMGTLGRIRRSRYASVSGRWQVSQVHLAHDVAHAPLEVEQVDRYVSRSRKTSVYEAARQDLTTLYTGLDDPLHAAFADDTDALMMGGLDWEDLYGSDEAFGLLDPFGSDDMGWASGSAGRRAVEEPEPVEERASSMHRWGRRVSGITWSPGAAVSFVAYDKVLESRLRGKSHMLPIWKSNGWDGTAPVTRHEARLRRDALRALGMQKTEKTEGEGAEGTNETNLDDPWVMLEHQHDIFGYVVGRPSATEAARDCPAAVEVAWLRRVVPDPHETNRSRWPTDPVWAAVQAPQFTDAPAEVRRLIRREVRSQQIAKRDRGAYGLVVSRTALAFVDPKHWELSYAVQALYRVFEEESQKPGKDFHELVRRRRRELGLPVPPENRVLPFRSQPSPVLPTCEIDGEDAASIDDGDERDTARAHNAHDAQRLALLRTERRLDELDVALDAATHAAQAAPTPTHRRQADELERAYRHELQVHEAIRRQISGDSVG